VPSGRERLRAVEDADVVEPQEAAREEVPPLGILGGFNAPSRVVLTRNVRPGQSFRIAVLVANGPLSDPPANYVWVRSATLDIYSAARVDDGSPAGGRVVRRGAALDRVVATDARIEKLAEGFLFTEGPAWHPDGYLLVSDPNDNRIWRYGPDDTLSIYRTKSGYAGSDIGAYRQPGSNGLAFDAEGRLVVCEHGNRRVVRIERNGTITVVADRYDGKLLNSPNDVVVRSDGWVYFTDPPFGLPQVFDDPRKELPFSGVYRAKDGKVELLARELIGPNGLAFSPDERVLYVANWDPARKVVMRHEVRTDGTLSAGSVHFDMTGAPGEEALDGLKVTRDGDLLVSGPGGVWVLSPEGKHLGTIESPELPANLAFGGDDGKTLYLAARTGLYRMRLGVSGAR
jgi:gluconolactonase